MTTFPGVSSWTCEALLFSASCLKDRKAARGVHAEMPGPARSSSLSLRDISSLSLLLPRQQQIPRTFEGKQMCTDKFVSSWRLGCYNCSAFEDSLDSLRWAEAIFPLLEVWPSFLRYPVSMETGPGSWAYTHTKYLHMARNWTIDKITKVPNHQWQ